MTKKIRISVESVRDMLDTRAEINHPVLSRIQWTLDSDDLEISEGVIGAFQLTGLNNCDFISTNAWKKGVNPEVLRKAEML